MRRWKSSPDTAVATDHSAGSSSLVDIVINGDIGKLRHRLKQCGWLGRKRLVNTRSAGGGQSLLQLAVKHGHGDIVRLLVDKGAKLDTVDGDGWTVVHQAAATGHVSTMELLLSLSGVLSALLDQCNNAGQTPLHLAVKAGYSEVVSMMLEAGADMESTDRLGWTALQLAVVRGHPDCVIALMYHGVNVNRMSRGYTPLHLAVVTGRVDIVSLLINKGADTTLKNIEGRTALDIARDTNNTKIAAIILEREFQTGAVILPSPPPTPRVTTKEKLGIIDRWKSELIEDINNYSDDDINDKISIDSNENISESFSVEKNNLLKQLETARQKQEEQLRTSIDQAKTKHQHALERISKRAKVLLHEISGLRQSVPTIQEEMRSKFESLKNEVMAISAELKTNSSQCHLMTSLAQNMGHLGPRYDHKRMLVQKLLELHDKEMRELKELKEIKLKSMERCDEESQKKVTRIDQKIEVLSQELNNLGTEKRTRIKDHSKLILKLEDDLRRVESSVIMSNDSPMLCPQCLRPLECDVRIYQCQEGHVLCGQCHSNAQHHCPQCHQQTKFSRNRALEQIVAKLDDKD